MVSAFIALATEDELSEEVGLRLLHEVNWPLDHPLLLRKNGNGYLSSKMDNWCQLAAIHPVVLITDLDNRACPTTLKDDWFGHRFRPDNFQLRVAVRQIESWLLADHEAIRNLLGTQGQLPNNPDALQNAKQHLLQLAKSAKGSIRKSLIVTKGATASQGIGYNNVLGNMVKNNWSPSRASKRSHSLARTLNRLRELATRLGVAP